MIYAADMQTWYKSEDQDQQAFRDVKSSRFFFLIALALVVGCGTTSNGSSYDPPRELSLRP